MLSSAEDRLWLRYMAVDRIRQFKFQLESSSKNKSFHLAFHGALLDQESSTDLIPSLRKCSTLESIFLDDFQCSTATWTALFEKCIRGLVEEQTNKARRFTLLLRRIQVNNNNNEDNSEEDEQDIASGVLLARSLARFLQPTATAAATATKSSPSCVATELELHLIDCDLTSHAAEILFSKNILGGVNTMSLRLLSLEGNDTIGNVGLEFLAQALTTTTAGGGGSALLHQLKTLSIERVGASGEGLHRLLESIRHHPNLQCLNLMGNHLDPNHLELLRDLLAHDNQRLERVQWESGSISAQLLLPASTLRATTTTTTTTREIDFWLRVNRAGRRRWLCWGQQQDHGDDKNNNLLLQPALWPFVLEPLASKDPEVLYWFLRSRPELSSNRSPLWSTYWYAVIR